MLNNVGNRKAGLSKTFSEKREEKDEDLLKAKEASNSGSKDDSAIEKPESDGFSDHQYWKAPDMFDLDDLLNEVNDPGEGKRAEREQLKHDFVAG